MRKGAYCELWHFTNQGLWAAEKAATSQEDLDYVAICQDEDDSQVLVVATSSELPMWRAIGKGESALKLVADEELSWEDFMEATLCIITAMKDNDQKALLAYQAQQRWLWHLAVGTAHNWSLVEINEHILQCTKDAIITNAHKEELKALKESPIPQLRASMAGDSRLAHMPSSPIPPRGNKRGQADTDSPQGPRQSKFCKDGEELPCTADKMWDQKFETFTK
ncbi:hypothetical protein ID866_12227 [Astraeus odoratus]|nr:hypothetical protein ID866_12227 [Astraeus odoratus]